MGRWQGNEWFCVVRIPLPVIPLTSECGTERIRWSLVTSTPASHVGDGVICFPVPDTAETRRIEPGKSAKRLVYTVCNRLCVWMEGETGDLEVALIIEHTGHQLFSIA
jgi:hypothetical protein